MIILHDGHLYKSGNTDCRPLSYMKSSSESASYDCRIKITFFLREYYHPKISKSMINTGKNEKNPLILHYVDQKPEIKSKNTNVCSNNGWQNLNLVIEYISYFHILISRSKAFDAVNARMKRALSFAAEQDHII